jgi:hypothetical protein
MKKVILASVAVVAVMSAGSANAASSAFCSGGSAMSFSIATPASTATDFVKTSFNARCSSNVHLVGDDQGLYYRVGATSIKGKQAFGGSTMGGGVTGTNCAGTACTATDASAAATNAATA